MSEKQKEFLVSIGIDPNDELDVIEDKVGDYLTLNCLDENYNPNEEGLMCESILATKYIKQLYQEVCGLPKLHRMENQY